MMILHQLLQKNVYIHPGTFIDTFRYLRITLFPKGKSSSPPRGVLRFAACSVVGENATNRPQMALKMVVIYHGIESVKKVTLNKQIPWFGGSIWLMTSRNPFAIAVPKAKGPPPQLPPKATKIAVRLWTIKSGSHDGSMGRTVYFPTFTKTINHPCR